MKKFCQKSYSTPGRSWYTVQLAHRDRASPKPKMNWKLIKILERGWYLVSPFSVIRVKLLFGCKLMYIRKWILLWTKCAVKQNPDTFKQEAAWFTKGFRQPKARLEILALIHLRQWSGINPEMAFYHLAMSSRCNIVRNDLRYMKTWRCFSVWGYLIVKVSLKVE